jgi:hypothetical protein
MNGVNHMKPSKLNHHRTKITLLLVVLTLLITLVLLTPVLAQRALTDTYQLDWFSIDSGGGRVQGGGYTLNSIAGQPDVGALSSASYSLSGGFLKSVDAPSLDHQVHLPLIMR